MGDRTFRTSDVLAAIHSFPAIMAVKNNSGIIEAFDQLRDVSPKIAGVEHGRDHLSWSALSQATKLVLEGVFPELAKEQLPDAAYWSTPAAEGKDVKPEKLAALGQWVSQMEAKYGATLEVPDISAAVTANLEYQSQRADGNKWGDSLGDRTGRGPKS